VARLFVLRAVIDEAELELRRQLVHSRKASGIKRGDQGLGGVAVLADELDRFLFEAVGLEFDVQESAQRYPARSAANNAEKL
jgi:hypothetical protein